MLSLYASEPSTVDTARGALEALSDRWFFWLVFSSVIVGVGVALEAPDATIALKRWYRHWKGKAVCTENERSLAIPASYLGLLLVIAGVAGEGVFEFLASRAEGRLRTHDEKILAQAIKDAETEHLARAKIEAAVAWRSLGDKEKRDLGEAFARFGPSVAVSVWYNLSSTEAEMFANDIAAALRYGHIATSSPTGELAFREVGKWDGKIELGDTGVIIQSTKAPGAIEFAEALIKELTVRGFDAKRQTEPPFDPDPRSIIWIQVESRPRGPQGEYKLQAEQDARTRSISKTNK